MSNSLISLSLLVGLSLALQPGLEYRYRYNGRLATGIIEKRHQLAAVGMEMDVTVQMAMDLKLSVKFDNIIVGNFHGDHSCDLRRPIPIAYTSLEEGKDLLQYPFLVLLNGKNESFMDVPVDEPAWVTNIRKAVIGMFPFKALWEEMKKNKHGFPEAYFGKDEDLIGERCMSWYTAMQIPEHDIAFIRDEMESELEEDIQRESLISSASYKTSKDQKEAETSHQEEGVMRETDVPPLQDKLWIVTKTIDYHMCNKPVEVTLSGNKESEASISRTSVSRYIIRGDSQGIRMENAIAEGAISVFGGSSVSQFHIDTLTNQTLQLRAVSVIQNKISVDHATRQIHSLHYQGDSMHRQDEGPNRYFHFEEKLLGAQRRGDNVEELKEKLFSALDELSSPMNNLVTAMDTAVQVILYLSYEEIDFVYELLQERVLSVGKGETSQDSRSAQLNVKHFKMALTLGGSEPAIKFLLDLLEDDVTRRSDNFVYFFFKQIGTTLKAPNLIPRIMKLATLMSWESDEDLAKTMALTSAASLFGIEGRKTKLKNSAVQDETRGTVERMDTFFISYLKEGIQNASLSTWQRVIYIQSLLNTGTPHSLEILHPIILGIEDEPTYFRTTAMAALSSHLLPETAQEMVFSLLTPLMENTGEAPEVRGMAFLTMASWHPGPSWWKRMALSTWHEPSLHFANLVSSTIGSIAQSDGEMKEMVTRVAYLARPGKGVSLSLSTSFYLENYLWLDWAKRDTSIVWLASTEGIIPTHIFISYELQRLQGFPSVTKIAMSQQNMDFFLELIKQYRDQFKYGDERPEGRDELFQLTFDIIMELGMKIRGFPSSAEWFLKSNNNFLHAKTVEFFGGGVIFGFIRQFQRYLSQVFDNLYYEKSIDTTYSYPTDLGIPFIVQFSSQKALRVTTVSEPLSDSDSFSEEESEGSYRFTVQVSQETAINTKTLVPWLKSSVGSGIRNEANVILPLTARFAGILQTYQGFLKITLPNYNGNLLTAANHPYTVLYKSLLPLKSHIEEKHINKTGGEKIEIYERVMPWIGSWIESCFNGEDELPDVFAVLSGNHSFLTPSSSNWNYRLTFEAEASDTKSITFSFTYAPAVKKLQGSADETDTIGHESEKSSEYSSSSHDGGVMKEGQEILQFIKQLQAKESDVGNIKTIGLSMRTSGSVDLKYRVYTTIIENDSQEMQDTRFKLLFYHDTPMGLASETFMTCFDVGFQRPDILPLTSVEEILNKDFKSQLLGKVWHGRSCEEANLVLDIKGNMAISKYQMDFVRDNLEKGCEYNPEFPLKDVITSQLYDTITLEGTHRENFRESWKELIIMIYDWTTARIPPQYRHYPEDHRSKTFRIRATKYPGTNIYRIRLTLPREFTIYSVSVPPFLGFLASPSEMLTHRVLNGRNPGACAVSTGKVHTFDGEKFPVELNSCWKVAAADISTNSIQIHVRHSDQWEAKVLWVDRGLRFDLSSSSIQVNNKAPSEMSEIYRFVYSDNAVLLILNIGIAVKVSNKVEIEMPFSYRSYIVGLCGKYDGERQLEFLGPKGCDYSDHTLFAAAWELDGDVCDAVIHSENKKKVEEYQSTCQNSSYIPTGVLYRYDQIGCTSWEYQVRKEGPCSCTALVLTPKCNPGCTSNMKSQKQIQFNCIRAVEHSDKDVDCSNPQTYVASYPTGCRAE
ncbi:hemolymph clottable protein-like [Macrobrachium nipponense]|uniref:hemolymph clottable protein-like n=1 Tax=Macrobrachium nipponense TaxID=159736 RepID=UPI0030C83638